MLKGIYMDKDANLHHFLRFHHKEYWMSTSFKYCSDKVSLSQLPFKMYLIWQKSLSVIHLILNNASNYSKPLFSCVWKCWSMLLFGGTSCEWCKNKHHCNSWSCRRQAQPSKVSLNRSIAEEDFHQQKSSGWEEKSSASNGPGCWSWHVPSPSSPISIYMGSQRAFIVRIVLFNLDVGAHCSFENRNNNYSKELFLHP